MKRGFSAAVFGLVFLGAAGWGALGRADKLTLKDGRVYEGRVLGKSDRRYLFAVDASGENIPLSFFADEVEKVEMDKDSAVKQIPYLKEVDSVKFDVGKKESKIYELSLYNQDQKGFSEEIFTEAELQGLFDADELAYYQKFNALIGRHADKFVIIENLYANLTQATKEDFARSQQYMDQLYFELRQLKVPEAFRASYAAFQESVKETSLAFAALDKGFLEEASERIKRSREIKVRSMKEFQNVVEARRKKAAQVGPAAVTAEKAKTP